MGLKAVLFDMDGLMIDTERLSDAIWMEVAPQLGWTLRPEDMSMLRGANRAEGCRRFLEKYGDAFPFEAMADAVMAELTRRLAQDVPLMPGLLPLLAFLQGRGVPMAVASSTHHALVESNLCAAGVRSYFAAVVCGDMVQHSKPAPEIYLKAAQALHLPPAQCMVLEDSYNGVRAGAAAGCRTVMVPNMDPATPEMERLADAIVPDLFAVISLWKEETDALD